MKQFEEILSKVTSSPHHNKMMRFVKPLKDHFGVNHFWYYRITFSGHYSYVGTHQAWSEYCLDSEMIDHFSCLRHPTVTKTGLSLMKPCGDEKYKKLLDKAWEKFRIHFSLNMIQSTADGIEAYGFGSQFNDQKNEERLLNELPSLIHFTKVFKQENQKIFDLLENVQADLTSYIGPVFYEIPKGIELPLNRSRFLRDIGYKLPSLTPRELDILKFLANGFPASYMAKKLHLSSRTIENYVARMKIKLLCTDKVELIQKAQEISSIGYFSRVPYVG